MLITHYFNAHFVQKQTNRKFYILDRSHGLIHLQKSQYSDFVKYIFLQSRKAFFSLNDHQTLFQGLFCPETNKDEIFNF